MVCDFYEVMNSDLGWPDPYWPNEGCDIRPVLPVLSLKLWPLILS